MQQKQYNDSLTQIVQMSFPFNHILLVTLLQRTPNMASNQRDYHEKYFFMITFAPGVGGGANRTYDFKGSKVTQKFATREIFSLAEILYQCAIGNDLNVLPYAKFSRSQNNQKQTTVWVSSKQQNIAGQQRNVRSINLTISLDKNKQTIALSPDQAMGMSSVLKSMYDRAIKLEIDNFSSQPFQQQNDRFKGGPANQQQQGFQPQNNNAGFNPNVNAGNQINTNMSQQAPPNSSAPNPYGN